MAHIRGVAQPGRVLGLGPRCRRFEPSHPDHKFKPPLYVVVLICVCGYGWSIPCNEIAPGSKTSRFCKCNAAKSSRFARRHLCRGKLCNILQVQRSEIVTVCPQAFMPREPSHPDQKIQIGLVPIFLFSACTKIQKSFNIAMYDKGNFYLYRNNCSGGNGKCRRCTRHINSQSYWYRDCTKPNG